MHAVEVVPDLSKTELFLCIRDWDSTDAHEIHSFFIEFLTVLTVQKKGNLYDSEHPYEASQPVREDDGFGLVFINEIVEGQFSFSYLPDQIALGAVATD